MKRIHERENMIKGGEGVNLLTRCQSSKGTSHSLIYYSKCYYLRTGQKKKKVTL